MLPTEAKRPIGPITFSAAVKMGKKQSKEMRRLLNPLTRPAQVSQIKKVSWRLTKKWFNRYEKPRFIGRTVIAEAKDGSRYQMQITDVRISKAGGHKRDYNFQCKPI